MRSDGYRVHRTYEKSVENFEQMTEAHHFISEITELLHLNLPATRYWQTSWRGRRYFTAGHINRRAPRNYLSTERMARKIIFLHTTKISCISELMEMCVVGIHIITSKIGQYWFRYSHGVIKYLARHDNGLSGYRIMSNLY